LEEWTVPIDQTTNNVDRPNLGNLIEEHQPRLKSYIRKRVSNKEDADDILQDVFYQLVKSFDETVSPIYEVSAWLYRVAHNTIVNKYKKKKEASLPDSETDETFLEDLSEILIGSEDTAPSPEMEYLRSLVWVELEQALGELPAEQRDIFEKTELECHTVKEISKATGVPVNTLLSRKHYAVKHLRKQLAELYNDIISK
jgi:RNA polymerase sigma factor (sigma-70 family)